MKKSVFESVIPVNEPALGAKELDYVTECLHSGWISSQGEYIDRFERAWADVCERKRAVAVSNGTVALQLAVASLDLAEGSEIIMPSFTIISCALAALYNGCKPVLVDCDPETYCIDVEQVAEKIGPSTSAIMPVHIYGHPADMSPLLELASHNGLRLIEDAAEAHGALYSFADQWRTCGSFGDVSIFSFYANKLITTGEGGMVLTDDDAVAERAKSLRNLAFGARRFVHEELGYNFRLTNVQAAIGLAQVERFPTIIERKRHIGTLYSKGLAGAPGLILPIERPWARSVYWMYGIVLDEDIGMDASGFANDLFKRGIDTRPFFVGMHEQPALKAQGLFSKNSFPVTERISRQGLYLPSGLALTDQQIEEVCQAVRDVLS